MEEIKYWLSTKTDKEISEMTKEDILEVVSMAFSKEEEIAPSDEELIQVLEHEKINRKIGNR